MRTSALAIITAIFLAASSAGQSPAPAGEAAAVDPGAGYSWAPSCKECHEAEYDSWQRTKHARALERLSKDEQQKDCLGCHVTGPKVKVEKEGALQNGNVQCESCHGAAGAHAADPDVRTGLMKKPSAAMCERCHNATSPSFKGFYYGSMVSLSHPGLKKK
jgi:cytochrome c553